MEDDDMCDLSALSFSPSFERQLHSLDRQELIPARFAAEHRAGYEVWSRTGSGRAQLAGRRWDGFRILLAPQEGFEPPT